jgi:hypothetical protein
MKTGKTLTYGFAVLCLILPAPCNAQGRVYVINDCNDSTQFIETAMHNSVKITARIDAASEPSKLKGTLKNKETGVSLTEPLKDGRVIFEGVSEGDWILCAEPGKQSFKEIELIEPES